MNDIDAVKTWYEENRPRFESLSHKVGEIIKENLEQKDIHSVTDRAKDLEKFIKKARKEKYTDPINQIKDMAGARVITYLESDVAKVADVIKSLFAIDPENSLDKSQLLRSNELGYRSVHYVAKFPKERLALPENKKYKDLPFEIQIRTILQHAWAEIEHDRNYQLAGKLPTPLERRFYLMAGMLEMADREFVAIAREIDKYKKTVAKELSEGSLDIEINTASLTEYLLKKFGTLVQQKCLTTELRGSDQSIDAVEELRLFDISKLNQLDEIIPLGLEDKILKSQYSGHFQAIIRYILMIKDLTKYFEKSWGEQWHLLGYRGWVLLKEYGVDITSLQKYLTVETEETQQKTIP